MPSTAAERARISSYVETMRKRLVDLTGRNRLISFRPQKSSSLEILHPNIASIWGRLMTEEKSWHLVPGIYEEEQDGKKMVEVSLDQSDCASASRRGQLAARAKELKLHSSANYIRRQATEMIDETGTNHLFLAMGFLKWFERNDSEVERLSPLLLIPITINSSKLRSRNEDDDHTIRYDISHDGNELSENLSIKLRLEEDFGISLPKLNDETDPDEYLEEVEKLISKKTTWEVIRSAHLAFFSFAKLRMYKDLDPEAWPAGASLLDNALVRDLLDGSERIEENPSYGAIEVHDDHTTAHEIPLVCEADSSQHTAILKVVEGRNTVIEGPPGTGKSQTITNIIAATIAQGKTVLFLSEKKAALDVVHDNLQRRGLGDFCLELHAAKSNKSQVHESFRKREKAIYQLPSTISRVRREWQESHKGVVDYVKALASEGGPWLEPLHASFGRAISLRAQGLPSYRTTHNGPLPEPDQLAHRIRLLQDLSNHLHNPEEFRDHPWKGFLPTRATPGDEERIETLFAKLFEHVRRLHDLECEFGERTGLQDCLPHFVVARAMNYFPDHLKDDVASVFGDALSAFHATDAIQITREVLTTRDAYYYERGIAVETLTDAGCDNELLVESLERGTSAFGELGFETKLLSELLANVPAVGEAADLLKNFSRIAARLDEYGTGKARSVGDLRRLLPLVELISSAPAATETLISPAAFFPSTTDALKKAKEEAAALLSRKEALESIFVVEDAETPETINERRKTLRATGGSFFSFLNKDYRISRQKVLGYLRTRKFFKIPALLDSLEQLQTWEDDLNAYNANKILREALGAGFTGVDSDWDRIQATIDWCQKLGAQAVTYETAKNIATVDGQAELGQLLAELRQNLDRLQRVESEASQVLLAALQLDAIESANLTDSPDFLSTWSEWFRATLAEIKELVKSPTIQIDTLSAATKSARKALIHLAAIETNEPFKSIFGPLVKSLESDWQRIEATLKWVEDIAALKLPPGLARWLFNPDFIKRIGDLLETLRLGVSERKHIENILGTIQELGPLDRDWLFGLPEKSWREMVQRCEQLMLARRLISQWITFQGLRSDAEEHGLMLFVEKAIEGEFPIKRMADVYTHTLAERHGYNAMRKFRHLSQFSHRAFESTREGFAKSDKRLLDLNRKLVATKAADRQVPTGVGRGPVSHWTEGSLLYREMQKERSHIPIRQLMLRASTAVRALKPCMLMSPLSVAQYLDPTLAKFDLVVMDEASQIRPEDALGAVARANQLVVVGDTKQMPPSNLWQKQADEDDVEEDETSSAQDAESVLECALHSFQPVYRLKWHYRSLHEDLIKFSNANYYDNELIIFPSANPRDQSLGIRMHYLPEGRFQSGSRVNVLEAQAVAQAAVTHLMTRPQETLLVATMNRTQQVLIDDLIDKICQENEAAREVVEEARNREFEKFIVRNLENVQGDQRDVVFISFTYGKDPESGRPIQRWGPITGKSGRRRLNVLFSRAKMRIEAFTSLVSQDVNAEPGIIGGVNDFKNYLRFIQDGILFEEGRATGESAENDFELSVMNVIRAAGLLPIPQVGVASYRVDIGVCRPGEEGNYILGVECDGASYHSSRWARDRDRIREEVLRSRGWNLYRVWSTDWFRQHEDAKARLLDALRRASLNQDVSFIGNIDGDDLPVVQRPVTLSKVAAASGASIYEVRALAWKLVHFAGDDREPVPTGQAAPILSAFGCKSD